jgi:hypothetical protein
MGNCTSTRSVVSSPDQQSTSRIVTISSIKPGVLGENEVTQQKKKSETTSSGSKAQIIANQLLPFDEVSYESSDTHRLTVNESFDYEDMKVIFYEVSR